MFWFFWFCPYPFREPAPIISVMLVVPALTRSFFSLSRGIRRRTLNFYRGHRSLHWITKLVSFCMIQEAGSIIWNAKNAAKCILCQAFSYSPLCCSKCLVNQVYKQTLVFCKTAYWVSGWYSLKRKTKYVFSCFVSLLIKSIWIFLFFANKSPMPAHSHTTGLENLSW